MRTEEYARPDSRLLQRIKDRLPGLEKLLEEASSHWGYEDPIYRFYHQSFKVYSLQASTQRIVSALQELADGHTLTLDELRHAPTP